MVNWDNIWTNTKPTHLQFLSKEIETEKYIIENKGYVITLTRKTDGRIEKIFKRIASKNLQCNECPNGINKGDFYIRDKFFYDWFNYYTNSDSVKSNVNFICLDCWKIFIPKFVKHNWVI